MSPLRYSIVVTTLRWAILVTLALTSCASPTPTATLPARPPSYEELARHYAPVIRQGAASTQDFITAVDFDGDWVGNNNWENQPTGDLSACVYYSVVESETHWFLFYSLFHPRDYTYEWLADGHCESGGCHENDLESIQLTVEKDGTPFGRPKALETLAHDSIYLYTFDDSVTGNFLDVTGAAEQEQGHPVVYVEALGHGIYGHSTGSSLMQPYFGGVVTYRVGEQAEVPESTKDESVSYELVPIYTTLWPRREDVGDGRTFDGPFDYQGRVLPKSIDGEDFGPDKANAPWGYGQATGGTLSRGDWFLDPARALAFHAHFDGDFSLEYVYNLYLADLGLMGE
ncbi:MAG: hypothetical protein ISS49_14990 [Anaerolineae bacterium]|nr:hypothetical protein [Anaerolineae bacterium]